MKCSPTWAFANLVSWVLLVGGVGAAVAAPPSTAKESGTPASQVANPSQDCISSAARYHGVNETVLRAIAWNESRMNAWALNKNSNGSYDIGALQINSVHLKELAQFGITPTALFDPCIAAYVGAWKYRQKVNTHGNTWKAVGAYHSETPALRDRYSRSIARILQSWGVLPKIQP